jgi:hypothetical protein
MDVSNSSSLATSFLSFEVSAKPSSLGFLFPDCKEFSSSRIFKVTACEDDLSVSPSPDFTLKIRDDENSLQSGKRKPSDEGLAETSKERKLVASEEELDTSIKLETTSC